MKKIVALVLCVVMTAGLLTGCQKPMDVETLTRKMDEACKNVTAESAEMDVAMELEIEASGVTMTVKMDIDATSMSQKEPAASYTELKMALELMGQKQESTMEMYGVLDGDTMVSYAYDSENSLWTKVEQTDYADYAAKLNEASFSLSELPLEKLTLAEEKELIGERECYVLTADIDGGYLSELINALIEGELANMGEVNEQTQSVIDMLMEADWSPVNMHMVYYVDAETFLPLQYTGEITGVGEVLNGMFATLMESVGEELPEDVEFTVEVPTLTLKGTDLRYEGVEVPAVPQEAIDNAMTAEELEEFLMEQQLPGGGVYALSLGGDDVSVVLPAAYGTYEVASDCVSAMNMDGTSDVTYVLIEDMSEEDLVPELLEEVEWAKQEGWYLSHTGPVDYLGFRSMTLIFNDDTATYYYWKQLDNSLLFINLYVVGDAVSIDELLVAVKIP